MFKFGCCTTDEELVICHTQLLAVNGTTKRAYLSVAMHAGSGDLLGWNLSERCAAYRALQYAIHASLADGRHFGEKKLHYIVDFWTDSIRIEKALNDMNLDVTFSNSMSRGQSAQVERFFLAFNRYYVHMANVPNIEKESTMTPAALRKNFEACLKIYQHGPAGCFHFEARKSGQKPLKSCSFNNGDNHRHRTN